MGRFIFVQGFADLRGAGFLLQMVSRSKEHSLTTKHNTNHKTSFNHLTDNFL